MKKNHFGGCVGNGLKRKEAGGRELRTLVIVSTKPGEVSAKDNGIVGSVSRRGQLRDIWESASKELSNELDLGGRERGLYGDCQVLS